MDKSNITRSGLKSNIMKSILFRIDYNGVLETSVLLDKFYEEFKSKFQFYETAYPNSAEQQLWKISEVSDAIAVPVKEIEKQPAHRFTGNTFGSDAVQLDLGKYSTALSIDCKNYSSIDEYLYFFAELTVFLKKYNPYIAFKRFTLRKIGGNIYDSLEAINQDFENKYFDFDFSALGYHSVKTEYMDTLQQEADDPTIRFRRVLEKGFLKGEGGELSEAYQVLLDLEASLTDMQLQKIPLDNVEKTIELYSIINEKHLFELFKTSMTESFLSRYGNG